MATSTETSALPAAAETPAARRAGIGLLCAGIAVLFVGLFLAYFFAFRAVREAQIKDVPLATSGGRK